MGAREDEVVVDCAIARGLDYYTATVFETVLTDIPELGSVCSGGRFDNLAQYYTRRSLPGVGISIGLTRLFDGLWDAGHFDGARATTTQVVVWTGSDDAWSAAGALASDLRAAGVACEVSLSDTKLAKILSRASRLGVVAVVIIGEDELEHDAASIKVLATEQQERVGLADVVEFLHKNAL